MILRKVVRVCAALLALSNSSSLVAQVQGRADLDEATVERIAALGDLYAAIYYFHPDVAPYDSARRAWDDAVSQAIQSLVLEKSGSFRAVLRSLLDSLGDPHTHLEGEAETALAGDARRSQRVWRYRGYPPEVMDRYGGAYKPFRVGWSPTGSARMLKYRVALPDGDAVILRYSEAMPEDTAAVVDPKPPSDSPASMPDPAYPEPGRRVIAAYRVRSIARYFYPYRDLTGEDWDHALRESIPRLLAARDSVEYALAVAEMVTRFHDSHVGVSGPGWSAFADGAHPPVGVRVLGDDVVVTGFSSDSVRRATGLEVGDIVLAVDGEPIRDRMRRLSRYYPASTPQGLNDALKYALLGVGPEGSVSSLRVRDAIGRVRDVEVARTTRNWWLAFRDRLDQPVVRRFEAEIGYIDLTRLRPDSVDSAFAELADTRAIIFDMRGYPRGTAWSIAPRLAARDGIAHARGWTPIVASPDPRVVGRRDTLLHVPPRKGAAPYRGETVMLIDERAVSQAEYTGMMFRAAAGTRFVGTATAGANGDVTDFALPGRLRVSFTGTGIEFPGGERTQRRGLSPDVYLEPTPAGLRAGRDEVLEGALELLRSDADVPSR